MARTKREAAIHDTLDRLIETLKREGADQARVGYGLTRTFAVNVRQGQMEGLKTSEAMKIGMRIWIGAKSEGTSVETNNPDDLLLAARALVQAARAKPDDPATLPAHPSQFAKIRTNKSLDLYDPTKPDSVAMLEQVRSMEAAALAVPDVVKSKALRPHGRNPHQS